MIWPFKKKSAVPADFQVDAKGLLEAAKTIVIAAAQYNADRIRQDLQGFSGPGIEPGDWVVEARRKDAKDFLIWSIEHGSWWRADHGGYTSDVEEAGRYSFDEVIDICNNPHTVKPGTPNEAIVLAATYQA